MEPYYTAHFDPNRHRKYTQNKRIDTGDMKGTIVLPKKYYRFTQKVLSFLMKGTIVFDERINQDVQEEIKKET